MDDKVISTIAIILIVFFGFRKIDQIKIMVNKVRRYASLPKSKLIEIDIEELNTNIICKFNNDFAMVSDPIESLLTLSKTELIILTLLEFNQEFYNKELFDYFFNDSRYTAIYLVESLMKIGAIKTATTFSEFLDRNMIDLNNLIDFDDSSKNQFHIMNEKYHLDEFDEAISEMYEIEGVQELIRDFIRNYIKENSKQRENKL